MLEFAILFLVLALVAGVFGFGGVATAFADIAKFLLIIFLVLAVAMLIL